MHFKLFSIFLTLSFLPCVFAEAGLSVSAKPRTAISAKDGKRQVSNYYQFTVKNAGAATELKASYKVFSRDDMGRYQSRETGSHDLKLPKEGSAQFRSRLLPAVSDEAGKRVSSRLKGYQVQLIDAEGAVLHTAYSNKQLEDFLNGKSNPDPTPVDPLNPNAPAEPPPEFFGEAPSPTP